MFLKHVRKNSQHLQYYADCFLFFMYASILWKGTLILKASFVHEIAFHYRDQNVYYVLRQ